MDWYDYVCILQSKASHVDFISADSATPGENIGKKPSIIFMSSFIVIFKSQFILKFLS